MRASLGLLFVAIVGSLLTSAAPVRAQETEPTVLIRVAAAYIGPRKANGMAWDGNDFIDDNVVSAAGAAIGMASPVTALAAALAPIANKHFQPPDIYGEVRLLRNGELIPCADGTPGCNVGVNLPRIEDNYMPAWDVYGIPVRLTDQISLKIRLADKDVIGEDPIPIIIIRAGQIRTAMARGGAVTYFRVDQQTNNLAYFIGLSVFNQSATTAQPTQTAQYQQPTQTQAYQQPQQTQTYQQQSTVQPTYWNGQVAPAYVAATEPVYWNGRGHYYYNGYWMYRDGPQWVYYRTEPTYFVTWRARYPNGRWAYRGGYR